MHVVNYPYHNPIAMKYGANHVYDKSKNNFPARLHLNKKDFCEKAIHGVFAFISQKKMKTTNT